jgi:hypothetical protein
LRGRVLRLHINFQVTIAEPLLSVPLKGRVGEPGASSMEESSHEADKGHAEQV